MPQMFADASLNQRWSA